MFHHFDARWATFERDGTVRDVTPKEKSDATFCVMPRYWVPEVEVDSRLGGWPHDWLLAWRDICRGNDERTVIAARLPKVAVGHTAPLVFGVSETDALALAAILSSFVLDFVARQKLGGTHLTYSLLKQLPVPTPEQLRTFCEQWPTAPSAHLDALAFRAYGLDRNDVGRVMDTFLIVRRKDLETYGEFRTRRLVLEAYDALVSPDRPTMIAS